MAKKGEGPQDEILFDFICLDSSYGLPPKQEMSYIASKNRFYIQIKS